MKKCFRFGLIVDETIICGIGADASVNLFTASSQCLFDLLFRPASIQVEQSVAVGCQRNVPARNLLAALIVRHKLH